ncbi:MAG: hypothetical protein PHV55_01280 [Candidatus Omnitrophica bacterium]|nr:hypothetical protein [Candidatus Omnitrophota bacterium]
MAKLKKGQKMACVPCGREVVVDACGASSTTLWCCGKPMARAAKSKSPSKKKKK